MCFYDEIHHELAKMEADADHRIIVGGDFNVILDPDLDGSGGKPKFKESCKKIENLCSVFDLIDIWRIRNPDVKRFSWRQKNPAIQRCLDYWLITDSLQEEVEKVDIIPAIRSDHSAITLHINGIENMTYGPSFWKFNASLLEDEEYVNKIYEKSRKWIEENREIQDPRVLWDFLKYKICYETIVYSKKKAKERRSVLVSLEERLKECQVKCDEDPTPENLNDLEIIQTEYGRHYDYITPGIIIRSRVNWYEQGEKSNKYFLNLENAKKKKSSIRKLSLDNDKELKELCWPTLSKHRLFHRCVFVYKYVNSIIDFKFDTKLISDIHSYNTRGKSNFYLP